MPEARRHSKANKNTGTANTPTPLNQNHNPSHCQSLMSSDTLQSSKLPSGR